MDVERRSYLRFSIPLVVSIKNKGQELWGRVKDFSRKGLKVVFDEFDFSDRTSFVLKIQRPEKNIYSPAVVEVAWKKRVGEQWEAGLVLKEFSSYLKSEILEEAFNNWLAQKTAAVA